jgi:hypothetical protein
MVVNFEQIYGKNYKTYNFNSFAQWNVANELKNWTSEKVFVLNYIELYCPVFQFYTWTQTRQNMSAPTESTEFHVLNKKKLSFDATKLQKQMKKA